MADFKKSWALEGDSNNFTPTIEIRTIPFHDERRAVNYKQFIGKKLPLLHKPKIDKAKLGI